MKLTDAAPHKDFETALAPPPGLSREELAMRLVEFWHTYEPTFRVHAIRHLESQPDYWSDPVLGLIVAVLRGLEHIGPPPPRDDTDPFQLMVANVRHRVPNVHVSIDKPARHNGHWFVDFVLNGHRVVAEWKPSTGFGITAARDLPYGERAHEVTDLPLTAAERIAKLLLSRGFTRPQENP